jgi:hypothetical protein
MNQKIEKDLPNFSSGLFEIEVLSLYTNTLYYIVCSSSHIYSVFPESLHIPDA